MPEELTASAQGLFAMITGLLMAGATFLAGPLYKSLGAHAYLVMILFPALALVILSVYRTLVAPAQPQSAGVGRIDRLPS